MSGRPFVGPAGRLLDRCLDEAGIDRKKAYVTNVVKHFKWTPRGKRRLHAKPNATEIRACRPWMDAEIAAVGKSGLRAIPAEKFFLGPLMTALAADELLLRVDVPLVPGAHHGHTGGRV